MDLLRPSAVGWPGVDSVGRAMTVSSGPDRHRRPVRSAMRAWVQPG